MKKKFVILTLTLLMAMSVFTGCGKSDEEKARDEIMSHMDADEKSNIIADQKEMEEYEAEKQAQADTIANEEPIDYSEVLTDKALSDITIGDAELLNLSININILLPEDEYLLKGYEDQMEMAVQQGMYCYGQNRIAYYSTFGATPVGYVSGESEDLGNYLIYIRPDTVENGINSLFIVEKGSDYALQINCIGEVEEYYDCAKSIMNKNYEYIKEQLQ